MTQTARARALRAQMTDTERKLWFALRDRRFAGWKFRRQVPIGRFIADFVCFEARVVIEVDGGQHADSARDRLRDRWLAENGFIVLRFWNNDVLQNLEGVLVSLLESLQQCTPHPAPRLRSAPPSPARGEGTELVAPPSDNSARAESNEVAGVSASVQRTPKPSPLAGEGGDPLPSPPRLRGREGRGRRGEGALP